MRSNLGPCLCLLKVRPYSRALLLQLAVCFLPFFCQVPHTGYIRNDTGGLYQPPT